MLQGKVNNDSKDEKNGNTYAMFFAMQGIFPAEKYYHKPNI